MIFNCVYLFKELPAQGGGGYFRNFGVGMCRGDPRTLEPLAYTGANSSEFCYPILDLTPQILPKFTCVYLFKELPAGGEGLL